MKSMTPDPDEGVGITVGVDDLVLVVGPVGVVDDTSAFVSVKGTICTVI